MRQSSHPIIQTKLVFFVESLKKEKTNCCFLKESRIRSDHCRIPKARFAVYQENSMISFIWGRELLNLIELAKLENWIEAFTAVGPNGVKFVITVLPRRRRYRGRDQWANNLYIKHTSKISLPITFRFGHYIWQRTNQTGHADCDYEKLLSTLLNVLVLSSNDKLQPIHLSTYSTLLPDIQLTCTQIWLNKWRVLTKRSPQWGHSECPAGHPGSKDSDCNEQLWKSS